MKAFTCFVTLAVALLSNPEGVDGAKTKYKPCGDIYKYQVVGALSNDFSTCSSKSGYDLENPQTLPTSKQRESICTCKQLLVGLQKIELPRCTIKVDNAHTSLKVFYGSIYSDCDLPEPKEAPLPLTDSTSSSGSMEDAVPLEDGVAPSSVAPVKLPSIGMFALVTIHKPCLIHHIVAIPLDGSQASSSGSSSDDNEIELINREKSGSEEKDDQSATEENTPPTAESSSSALILNSSLVFTSTIAVICLQLVL
jgi:hypothetical protein